MRKHEHGFTLIELLVVVAIIGILAAIMIPQYSEYRQRAFDARSMGDLRNAAAAEEAYFVDNESYKQCATGSACQDALPGFRWSPDVDLAIQIVAASGEVAEHFTARAFHPQGRRNATDNAFIWDSSIGGLQ